jgi:hypothetical protein
MPETDSAVIFTCAYRLGFLGLEHLGGQTSASLLRGQPVEQEKVGQAGIFRYSGR